MDKCQDEIFRLPLQYSLLLLGPAGSGKTTTLIRRLGQKLDVEQGLSDGEKHLVDNLSEAGSPHKTSWLMFTPTELLKNYLQEAFNCEGIPAPDRNITTWNAYNHSLGRNIFRILHTSNFKSGFQYGENCVTLIDGAANSINIYNDFSKWIVSDYIKGILSDLERRKDVERLKDNPVLAAIHDSANKLLNDGKSISSFLRNILKYKNDILKLSKITIEGITKLVDKELNRELNNNHNFLHDLSVFIKSLPLGEYEGVDEQDETGTDVFDGEEESPSESDLKKARSEYRRILLTLSQRIGSAFKKNHSARSAALVGWLGERKPSEQVLSKLQELAAEAKILGPLNNPINKFFRSINTKYRKFRKLRQSENTWYNPDSALKKKIDSTELDILILTNLAVSYELLSSSDIYRNTSDSWLSALDRIKNKYVNQVIVDEAPDFSPLQLGCMKLLSHPQINSFFACGDFNQRITSTGTKNMDDFNSIIPGKPVTIREIKTPYRQCSKLYEFSLEVLKMIDGKTIEGHSARLTKMIDGFSPVLGEKLKDAPLAVWIAERVTEIEKLLRAIPSIAILVPEEGYVKPVAQELQKALNEKTSAIVQACHEGQARGNGKAIRVFDIKHIKGLEFEAAFFVALDRLECLYPALLGNYLYVGATRAANFLGVSCEQTLPTVVVDTTALRDCFVNTWRT